MEKPTAVGAGSEDAPAAAGGTIGWSLRWQIWRWFVAALAGVLVALVLLFWLRAPGAPPGGRVGDEGNLETVWTEAESERLAEWPMARSGIWSPGPPALSSGPALARLYPLSRDSRAAASRQAFASVAVTMVGARRRTEAGQPTPLPAGREPHWLALLGTAEANVPASAAPLVHYQRALVHFWVGNIAPARNSLEQAGCAGDGAAASDPERGLRLACLWLNGRLKERRQPGQGIGDLRTALREALGINLSGGQMIFRINSRRYLIEVDTADLWSDYLSALLAQEAARPLDPEADSLVRDLAESPGELANQPAIVGMLKMLLVRQGQFSMLRSLPALESEASDDARRLSDIADVAADGTREDGVPALRSADGIELQNWIDHNCRRSERLGQGGSCRDATPEFASWEATWRGQMDSRIRGDGPVGSRIRSLAMIGLYVMFLLGAVWLLTVTFRRARHRQGHYHSKVRSDHFEESQQRRPASATRQGITDD